MKTNPYLKLLKQKKTKASFLAALLLSAVSVVYGTGFYAIAIFLVSFFALVIAGLTYRRLTDKKKWLARHRKFSEVSGDVDLLLVGDSLTANWPAEVLKETFASYRIVNFGINGDFTKDIRWRMQHGELENIHPKLVVLMCGANDIDTTDTAEAIAESIQQIVTVIFEKQPNARILLLGILPIERHAGSWKRAKINEVNKRLALLRNGDRLVFRDIGRQLTDEEGTLHKRITPDYLHLSKEGYNIFAKAISGDVCHIIEPVIKLQDD